MVNTKKKKVFVHYFPIYGCISTGLIYLGIGIIAILSFLKIKKGGADESSMLAYLNHFIAGKILIWVILLGTISYIIWRIFESIKDPYNYGSKPFGLLKRSGIALSSLADVFIAFSAIQVILKIGNIQEDGQPYELRELVAGILKENWGTWAIIVFGAITVITAVVQLIYGVTKGYSERQDIKHFSLNIRRIIHILAWAGYTSRGLIIGIIGFFFIKAGILKKAQYVVNTDKAFDFIGDDLGGVFFIIVAVGTICYGLFMFSMGATYDVDED